MDLSIETIIGAVVLLMGGGGLGVWGKIWIDKQRIEVERSQQDQANNLAGKHADQDFLKEGFKLAVEVITRQRDDAFKQVDELRRRLDNTELEIVGLKLSNSFDPFPRWMVDLDGRYLFVNWCFEERLLQPRGQARRDIVGETHDSMWPPEIGAKIRMLDQQARQRPDGRARAVVTLEPFGEVSIFKFPVKVHGVIVAYAGYIMEHV